MSTKSSSGITKQDKQGGFRLKDIKLITGTDGEWIFHLKEGKKPKTSSYKKKIDQLKRDIGT